MGIGNTAPTVAVKGECGRFSLSVIGIKNALRYWLRLINADDSSFISKCYKFQLRRLQSNDKCWLHYIKYTLCSIGFGRNWFEQYVENNNVFISEVTLRLTDIERQRFHEQITLYSRLKYYVTFKNNFNIDLYLIHIQNINYRRILTKLRLGVLELEIETGRWTNTDRNDRICKLCTLNLVEDEYHFTLICPLLR